MKWLIIATMIGLFAGCIPPATVYKITPADSPVEWKDGIGMINKTENDISIGVGYTGNRGDLLSFNLTIENFSDDTIEIDPAAFECMDNTLLAGADTNSLPLNSILHAVDPEGRIQQADMDISRENSDYSTSSASDAVGTVLDLVTVVGSIGTQKSEEEIERQAQQAEDNRRNRTERENNHISRIESLNQEKSFWETCVLRKTTLHPNGFTEGKIFFYPVKKADLIRLRFPIGSTGINAVFEQKKFRP